MWVKLNDIEIKRYKYFLCTSAEHFPPKEIEYDEKKEKFVPIQAELTSENSKRVCESCGMATVCNPMTLYREEVI